MVKKHLIGRKAIIKKSNDNENYDNYRDKVLVITSADNEGAGYDISLYPQMLCNFICEDYSNFPFALYEYEFDLL